MSLILSGTDGLSDVDGTAATPAIRGTDANTGIFFPAADTIAFSEGGAEVARFDSSSNLLVGTANTPTNRDTVTPKFIVNGAGVAGSMQVVRNTTVGGGGAILELTATRGTDANSYTILQSGDGVGSVIFGGADGTQFTPAAQITAAVDGTPGANDMPGRLVFNTTADGAGSATERMRIDSSGNVGIGTTTLTSGVRLYVSNATNGIPATSGTTQASGALRIRSGNNAICDFGVNGTATWIQSTDQTGLNINYNIAMQPNGGNLLVGTFSENADARVTLHAGSTDSSPCIDFKKGSATTTTSQVFARFWASGGSVATGSITSNGVSAATFTNYSDRRLKKNIVDLPSQLANIMALRPVEFDYIGYKNGEGHQLGFIAQEVQEIYPDLVGEGADGMLTLSDMNKNDARLIKAIQEMKVIIDAQASTITALTTRITALENN